MPESKSRTVTIWDRCRTEGCNRVLHSIHEGERGLCSSCWFKSKSPGYRKAMNSLLAVAFRPSTDAEKNTAIDNAMAKMREEG